MTKVKLIETDGAIGFNHEGVFITDVTVSDCGRFPYDKNEAMYQYFLTEEQYETMVSKSKEQG